MKWKWVLLINTPIPVNSKIRQVGSRANIFYGLRTKLRWFENFVQFHHKIVSS